MKIITSEEFKNFNWEEPVFVIAKNGILLAKENRFFRSVTKVPGISALPEVEEGIELKEFKKIPAKIFEEAIGFFRKVWALHRSEAVALLTFDDKTEEWALKPVKQRVSSASVEFAETVKNVVGTIHSHGEMEGFFSEIDDEDDANLNGFHFVIGKIWSKPQIKASVVINGKRFNVEISDLVESEIKIPPCDEWLEKVEPYQKPSFNPSKQEASEGFLREAPLFDKGYSGEVDPRRFDEVCAEIADWDEGTILLLMRELIERLDDARALRERFENDGFLPF